MLKIKKIKKQNALPMKLQVLIPRPEIHGPRLKNTSTEILKTIPYKLQEKKIIITIFF